MIPNDSMIFHDDIYMMLYVAERKHAYIIYIYIILYTSGGGGWGEATHTIICQ